MAKAAARPARPCNICNQTDDHPRHVQTVNGQRFMAHPDCCAAAGCADCTATEAETGGLRGQELIDHLAAARGK